MFNTDHFPWLLILLLVVLFMWGCSTSPPIEQRMRGSAVSVISPLTQGSGLLLDSHTVLTANHVMTEDSVTVITSAGQWREGTLIKRFPRIDVALVALNKPVAASPVRLLHCDNPPLGLEVFYVGNPRGIAFVARRSRLAHYHQSGRFQGLIDNVGMGGESGSGVVDSRGRVVGVLTALVYGTFTTVSMAAHWCDIVTPHIPPAPGPFNPRGAQT